MGYLRGYIIKYFSNEKFINMVVTTLNYRFMEKGQEVKLEVNEDEYIVTMDEYKVVLDDKFIETERYSYGVERYILEEFESQGYNLDKKKGLFKQFYYGNV